MKRSDSSILICALILLISVPSFGDDNAIYISSYKDISCGAWVKTRNVESVQSQYSSWFRGFISGYNYSHPENQITKEKMPSEDTIFLYVDKYCRENPLSNFIAAAFRLVEELTDNSPTQKTKPKKHK